METRSFTISPAAARLLERAEEFLRQPKAWTQGVFGIGKPIRGTDFISQEWDYELHDYVETDDDLTLEDFDNFAAYLQAKGAGVKQACAVGALEVAAKGRTNTPEFKEALAALALTVPGGDMDEDEIHEYIDGYGYLDVIQDQIITYNDHNGRRKADVVKLFARARDRFSRRGK